MSEGDRISFIFKILFIYIFPTSHCGLAGTFHACFELVSKTIRVLVALQNPPVTETFCHIWLMWLLTQPFPGCPLSLPLQLSALPSLPLCRKAHPNASPETNIAQTENKNPTYCPSRNHWLWLREKWRTVYRHSKLLQCFITRCLSRNCILASALLPKVFFIFPFIYFFIIFFLSEIFLKCGLLSANSVWPSAHMLK